MTSLEDRVLNADLSTAGVRIEEPADGVQMIVLDRPERLNALDAATALRLLDMLPALAGDAGVRAVVITGANGVFSAGADLESIDLRGHDRDEIEAVMRLIMQLGPLVHALPQPTIAAISGPVAGGALGLALACDLRIAGPDATFIAPFVHMGLVPDCGATWLVPHLAGEGVALELMLTGRPFDARRAHQTGLVTQLESDPIAAALALATAIARRPPQAVRATKRLVRDAAISSLHDAVEHEAVTQAAAFTGTEFATHYDSWRVSRTAD